MIDWEGWQMPFAYDSAIDEAAEPRRHAIVMDFSHAGRIRIAGDGALDLLERMCVSDVAHQEDDHAAPTLLCNDGGGIIDACTLIRLSESWLLVTSPSRRQAVMEHLRAHARDAKLDDQTPKTAQLVVAGVGAAQLLDKALPFRVGDLPLGGVRTGSLMLAKYTAWRWTLGRLWALHVTLPALLAGKAWDYITAKAAAAPRPAGMGAWDMLRTEGLEPRWGWDLNETIDPYQANLGELVHFGHDFVGKAALERLAATAPARVRVGLALSSEVAHRGDAVLDAGGVETGTITSSTHSPAMGGPVAMAYVSPAVSAVGTKLSVAGAQSRQDAQVSRFE
jgi:aminomethyltransferase